MNYKELKVWQKARALNVLIYQVTKDFPKEENWGIINQMRRSSVSVASNIAEGKGRQTTKEYIQFLYIAKGSCTELECQILLSQDIGYIAKEKSEELESKCTEIIKMLAILIERIKESY